MEKNRLCQYCTHVNVEHLRALQGQLHQPTYLALQQSSRSCELCSLIVNALQREASSQRKGDPDYAIGETWGPVRLLAFGQVQASNGDFNPVPVDSTIEYVELWHDVAIVVGPDATRRQALMFGARMTMVTEIGIPDNPFCRVERGSPAESLGLRAIRNISRLAMDDGNRERLLELLCHCDVHHTPCQPSFFFGLLSSRYVSTHGGNAMPSRLLDLQTQDSANIKLVDTPFGARYATLSYRWGTSQPFKLTRDNMSEAQAGVSVDRLAQAIQDAVKVSRSLFIRYLWADALCNIQDGDGGQDWQAESKKMGLMYANSYVTIAAATDGDLSKSFLTSPREPYVKVPARSRRSAEPSGSVLFAPAFFDFGEKFENATYNNTLSTRAWVKQERVLSRRTIHFTSQGLYFECGNSYWSEEGTHQTGLQFDGRRATTFLSTIFVLHRSPEGAARDLRVRLAIDAWYELVEQFCTLSLTKESDRLFALSGLANLAAQVFPGAYLSGLWEHTLSSGLLWIPISRPVACTVTERAHAPSWSWASIPGPGNLRVAGNIDMANEDKSRIRYLRSERPEGRSEILVLEGTIVSCCVATRPETRMPFRKFKDPVPKDVDNFRFWPRAVGVHPELAQTCDNICRFDGERGHDLEFYFMRLRCSGPEGSMHCCGLLLRQVGEDSCPSKTFYRRIGIGWASHASWHGAVSLVRLQ